MISSDDEARVIKAEKRRQERKAKKLCNNIEVEKANLSLLLTEEAHIVTASHIVNVINNMLTTVRDMQQQIDEDFRLKQYLIQRLRGEHALTVAFDDPMSKTVIEHLDKILKNEQRT